MFPLWKLAFAFPSDAFLPDIFTRKQVKTPPSVAYSDTTPSHSRNIPSHQDRILKYPCNNKTPQPSVFLCFFEIAQLKYLYIRSGGILRASLKMHFFRDSGISSVLESSFTPRKLRLSGRCFFALTKKILFLEVPLRYFAVLPAKKWSGNSSYPQQANGLHYKKSYCRWMAGYIRFYNMLHPKGLNDQALTRWVFCLV